MSIINSFITFSLVMKTSHGRISLHSPSGFGKVDGKDRSLVWRSDKRWKGDESSKRRFLVHAVEPGVPPPSGPSFNVINWLVGVAITVVLPFFSHKWASLLKLKNEVETAVQTAEEIVEAVEKAAEGVEKFAEDIIEDLPEGGRLRKAAEFVEHVAERAAKDAHAVDDFIDKVQEAEERVEDYVESFAEEAVSHHHQHKDEERPTEEKESPIEENNNNEEEEERYEEENNEGFQSKQ